jgi:hypothetical protein
MNKNKILILIPDGVGLRNFVFSDLPNLLRQNDFDLSYWNATPFNFKKAGFNSIELNGKPQPKSDLLKRARKIIEIRNSIQRTNDLNYNSYLFKPANKSFKQKVKNIIEKFYVAKYKYKLEVLRSKIKKTESGTTYFRKCVQQLKEYRPNLLVVSNQRPINAIAPVEAAKKMGIPTASFIFSWDNLPKATMVIETDYYLVWSELMKKQLLEYYPYISKDQVSIVGTPQFEIHCRKDFIIPKEEFFETYQLDLDKDYICFSGDDVTTSPHDQVYLKDLAQAVRQINEKSDHKKRLGIIFRPCPVDFSDRFDRVLKDFSKEIKVIRPEWKKHTESWNSVMPTLEDQVLLASTVAHTKLVVNVGSSMVFDYAAQNKPCMFINYNPDVEYLKKDIHKIYKYIHFQSMPNKNAVIWLNSKEEIADKVVEGLNNPKPYVENAKEWFSLINQKPAQEASLRIVETIKKIITNN